MAPGWSIESEIFSCDIPKSMKILICPDKFKGSLTALQVCRAIETGLKKGRKQVETVLHPMADGGDGSLDILSEHLDLKARHITVNDPLGRPVQAQYFTAGDVAFIELATASGLVLLKNEERNPLLTSTFGTGQMMVDALSNGCRKIYLFLGGSATNDAGMGIAAALGCCFFDENNRLLEPIGGNLPLVKSIAPSQFFDFKKVEITLLCDVTNPLFGKNGAARVYARQKGADEEQVARLDAGARHLSHILHRKTGVDAGNLPGSGAAGGIAACLATLFGAKIENGFDAISKLTGLEKNIEEADWVISGEGRLDDQSLQGKVVGGVAALCRKHNTPLTAFVGKNDLTGQELQDLGASAVWSISDVAQDMEDAMRNGAEYLELMAKQAKPAQISRQV